MQEGLNGERKIRKWMKMRKRRRRSDEDVGSGAGRTDGRMEGGSQREVCVHSVKGKRIKTVRHTHQSHKIPASTDH